MPDEEIEILDFFDFEVEEDDYHQDDFSVSALELTTGVGDWIKMVNPYHFRGSDLAQIGVLDNFALEVRWQSDGERRRYALDEVCPVRPTETEIEAATKLTRPVPLAAPPRLDAKAGKAFTLGEFVTARSPYSRYGSQLGAIWEVLAGDRYVVIWEHVVGIRPKDSKRNRPPLSWARRDLISAECKEAAVIKRLSAKR
jgi:hypothetical protein